MGNKVVTPERFQNVLNQHNAGQPLTEPEAAEAMRNLGGLLEVLLNVNKRMGLVPIEEAVPRLPEKRKRHAGQ